MGMKKNGPGGCGCCCDCRTGYSAMHALWSQAQVEISGDISVGPTIQSFTDPEAYAGCSEGGIIQECSDSAVAHYQLTGPATCGPWCESDPTKWGTFIFRYKASIWGQTSTKCDGTARGSSEVTTGPFLTWGISASCVDGVLTYTWQVTLEYSVISTDLISQPGGDCNGNEWFLPNLPNGTQLRDNNVTWTDDASPVKTTVEHTSATDTVFHELGCGGTMRITNIEATQQGSSTDINDIPTSFSLTPAYNPGGLTGTVALS